MSPKEKAKELVKKFEDQNYFSKEEILENAKYYAWVCAQQLIEEYENTICNTGYDADWPMWDARKEYWERVKIEIDNL